MLIFGSALSPLSVDTVLFTVTGAISPVIVIVYTNGSVYTNGCKALRTLVDIARLAERFNMRSQSRVW